MILSEEAKNWKPSKSANTEPATLGDILRAGCPEAPKHNKVLLGISQVDPYSFYMVRITNANEYQKKFDAIKNIRQATGLFLKDTKDLFEGIIPVRLTGAQVVNLYNIMECFSLEITEA